MGSGQPEGRLHKVFKGFTSVPKEFHTIFTLCSMRVPRGKQHCQALVGARLAGYTVDP